MNTDLDTGKRQSITRETRELKHERVDATVARFLLTCITIVVLYSTETHWGLHTSGRIKSSVVRPMSQRGKREGELRRVGEGEPNRGCLP